MTLQTIWFLIEALLWIGYFVLEGFDFGVGLSIGLIGRRERERQAILSTIMPVWDGNEVWLIVAGGAMFAAFPGWYATIFSTFYLPLLAILVGLIIRAVGLEYREHRTDQVWRRRWDACIVVGSFLPALLWGVAFANLVRGLPINAAHNFTGSLLDLLNPFALLAGLVSLALFLTHGSVFLALRTGGYLRLRARRVATVSGGVTAALAIGFLTWLNLLSQNSAPAAVSIVSVMTACALAFALAMQLLGRDGWSFAGTAMSVAGLMITFFVALYPRLVPSTSNAAWSLTVDNSAASHYTLTIMTWSAMVLVPLVLVYQGWTYWVFRKRIISPPVTVADPVGERRAASVPAAK